MTAITFADRVWPRTAGNAIPRAVALVLGGTLLLAASAHAKVPFWPVPMTMQTFVVLLLGAAYGWRFALATLVVYLVEGAAGLPVFAAGAGPAYMAGPTGGYLAGFLVAAVVAGWSAEHGLMRGWPRAVLSLLVADVLVFVLGVGWLGSIIGFEKALGVGLLPFLPAEALKIALAAALIAALPRAQRMR